MAAVVDVAVEEVASNLEEMAAATRRINTSSAGFILGGIVIGFGLGFYFGKKWNKEALRAEAFAQSEEEVEKIREHYAQKTVAAEPKPSPESIIEEKGYDRPLPAPVPIMGVVAPAQALLVVTPNPDGSVWDYAAEIASRVEGQPYVIHQDEFRQSEAGYGQVAYTYYAIDDVLVDEEDKQPVPHADLVVGQDNLKFGHGADDIDVVFVRNDRMELEIEICRIHESYEEEILGIDNSDPNDNNDN